MAQKFACEDTDPALWPGVCYSSGRITEPGLAAVLGGRQIGNGSEGAITKEEERL